MKQTTMILLCENCNKALSEVNIAELAELDVVRYEIYIKDGSTVRIDNESSAYIGGYYCSANCLADKIAKEKQIKKEIMV